MSGDKAVAWLREQVQARLEVARLAAREGGTWKQDDPVRFPGAISSLGGTVVYDEGAPDENQAPHIALNDPQDVIARCEAELAILDFRDLANTVARASDDGQTGERSEAQQAKRRLAMLDSVMDLLASGYRHHPGYGEHWGDARD